MKYFAFFIYLCSIYVSYASAFTLHQQNNFDQTSAFSICGKPEQKLFMYSQADVDNFKHQFAGCKHFLGAINIDSADIDNLDGLSNLESIFWYLSIVDTVDLKSLTDLKHLRSVDTLDIEANQGIRDLRGLEKLTHFNNLLLVKNTNLKDINSLTAHNVASFIFISENPQIRNAVSASYALSKTSAWLYQLVDNPKLKAIGPFSTNKGEINGEIDLDTNLNVENYEFLNKIKKINGRLGLFNMKGLTSLKSFNNLKDITGRLTIDNLSNLTNLDGLKNLNPNFSGQLYFYDNAQLVDCTAICPLMANKDHIIFVNNNEKCVESLNKCSQVSSK
ncbi:MAG: hypothetical protein ACPGUD_00360 [Parashewanella sp.]